MHLRHSPILLLIWLLFTAGCSSTSEPSIEAQLAALGEIDYNFHVKPILSQNCYLCHGPDASSREAELRLDLAEGAYAMRDSLPAITPGSLEKSLVFYRINAADPEERMPLPESHKSLTPLQIAILEKWIENGAPYKKHWSFIPPERPAIPDVEHAGWARNEIDRFVLSRLERAGLDPSPEADRRTLIRRLSFDLTGLPPSVDEVRAFVNDASDDAYEHLVDRLLASRHFGERMAVHWMDLARYADTNGYSIDGGRHMWLWRDWVIDAFNENTPYDRFVVEQLAGDLLPDLTEAQLVATGFNRNHMNTHEGGTIPEENLTNYVADRVKTTSEVFLGLTMGCAQCHDHKFDPISQRDYYRFFAFFNTTSDKGLDGNSGINSQPRFDAKTVLADQEEIHEIEAALEDLYTVRAGDFPEQPAWEEEQRRHLESRGEALDFHSLAPMKITTPNTSNTGVVLADSSVLIETGGGLAAYNVSAEIAQPDGAPITGLRIVFYPHEASRGYLGHGAAEELAGAFVMTSLTVSKGELPSDQVDLYNLVPFSQVTASSLHPDYPTSGVLDERRINGWAPEAGTWQRPQHLTATFAEPVDPSETFYLTAMLNFGRGSNLIPSHFQIFAMTGTDDGTNIPDDIQQALRISVEERTAGQSAALRNYFFETSAAKAPLRYEIANLEERLQVLTEPHSTMVMDVAPEPRETFILNRGQYDQPLEKVTPNTPAVLPALPVKENATRLDLARWLTDPGHPLTARVTVNRFWQMLFGAGIVATAADFGAQGSLPSHPELLDWLAVRFIDSDWDIKALLKTMVMSATYRQRASASERQLQRDPQNRLLARGPRFRLQAEFIRDAALKSSGLLVERIGGPSVNPYQPAGLWKEISHYGSTPATAQVFVQDHGEKLYRRSLYTYWKRTAPPPAMLTFDAPNREVCTVTREVTNTPLQALVLLNDPQFVEASRRLASRILTAEASDDDERLSLTFETVLSRPPNRNELKIMRRRLADERAYFRQDPEKARVYLNIGESPQDPALPRAEHAAWTSVVSMILNLSETITKV